MSDAPADFLVAGSTPLARLVAGLLAQSHGRRVIFVGESQATYRLPRSLDLSVAPLTRPESWALLRPSSDETARLITRIAGRGALRHIDPIFFADSAADREALAHCGQMAAGFGVAVEKVAPSLLGQGREGLLFRDAIRLNRPVLEPALDTWLAEIGVERPEISGLRIGLDGSAVVATSAGELVAHQAVLADDTAIIAWLPLQHWPMLLRRQAGATILTTPTKPLAAPAMVQIGSGTVLKQQAEGGIAALGSEDLAVFSGRLQALLGRDRQVEQAGQTGYQRLVSIDGGPLVGRAAGQGADIVAGLGMAGAFLAPALARWLAGAASPAEAAWFGARLVNRDPNDRRVAEFAPPLSEAKP